MSKADGYVCVRYKYKGNLITVLLTAKGSRRIWIVRDSGGGLSRSSDTASGRLGSPQGKHNIVRVDIPVILRPFYLITHNQ